jgi:predicted HAD superfamily Cof-like phosphohydrolase
MTDMFDTNNADDPAKLIPMVAEFQKTFSTSIDPELWKKLIEEETAEVMEAVEHLLKEVSDLAYVVSGYLNVGGDLNELKSKDIAIALQWSNFVMEAIGVERAREAIKRVHESNMSKLDNDGNVIRREDGKVLKGPNYAPPVLSDLVRG